MLFDSNLQKKEFMGVLTVSVEKGSRQAWRGTVAGGLYPYPPVGGRQRQRGLTRSDTPPTRPHLLIFPKQLHQQGTTW